MKETSQSTVIRKLSSYTQTNSTLKALIEFDKIIMSIYMLKYIHEVAKILLDDETINVGSVSLAA